MADIGASLGHLSATISETSQAVTEVGAQATASAGALADSTRHEAAQRIEAFEDQMKSAVLALETVLTNFRNELRQLHV